MDFTSFDFLVFHFFSSFARYEKGDLPMIKWSIIFLNLGQIRSILQPLMDNPPPDITQGGMIEKVRTLSGIKDLIKVGFQNR